MNHLCGACLLKLNKLQNLHSATRYWIHFSSLLISLSSLPLSSPHFLQSSLKFESRDLNYGSYKLIARNCRQTIERIMKKKTIFWNILRFDSSPLALSLAEGMFDLFRVYVSFVWVCMWWISTFCLLNI